MNEILRASKLMKVKGKMHENKLKKVFDTLGQTVHGMLFPKWSKIKPKKR